MLRSGACGCCVAQIYDATITRLLRQVPRGLARAVGMALAGSSGQGWRG